MSDEREREQDPEQEPEREHEQEQERDIEERVRELLAEDAYTIRPSPAPYPAIRRRGTLERRRRMTAAGAALVTLAAVPVGAYAVGGGPGTGTPQSSAGATLSPSPTPTKPAPKPSGPAGPATAGQLLDGITLAQAADGLNKCLAYDRSHEQAPGSPDLGTSAGYRIILAMRSTGDSNAPGAGVYVVAVKERAKIRLVCTVKNGAAEGLGTSVGDDSATLPDGGPVYPDMNGGKLYQQSVLDKGNWKLPFRWGAIGRVKSSVSEVTVSYGDTGGRAVLDHGWFVASGILNQQVTKAPRIKGYDAHGRLVYDSDQDKYYEKTLP
ncbi:hypothetical protein ABZT03_26295 [Streptomyces sp. NPDC005574]|uniref:hypothetical protein n=1 Tax=Streptomyces sp. NPDC005574 TaxID=3156891 RepID=UPI0033A98872